MELTTQMDNITMVQDFTLVEPIIEARTSSGLLLADNAKKDPLAYIKGTIRAIGKGIVTMEQATIDPELSIGDVIYSLPHYKIEYYINNTLYYIIKGENILAKEVPTT